jgi:tetratricopeptide (TPR) repeat protein
VRGALVAIVLAAALGLAAPAAAQRDEDMLARADALLAAEPTWAEAIAIYRTLAAADPTWTAPRQQLARVLAWRGDYDDSLALYDELLAAPEPPADAAVERAEVLSWAGRTAEARAAFEARLAARPEDPRAARGMARVQRWAGERAAADAWYARALALAEDEEARREWDALRAELRRGPALRSRWFRDSDDFTYLRSTLALEMDWDFDTKLRATSGATRVTKDVWERGSRFADEPNENRGFDATLAVERRLAPRWKGELELGARGWQRGGARPLVRAALELAPDERSSARLELRHDDLLERSFSLPSALRGIGDTSAAASYWRQLSPRFEMWSGADGSVFTDGNGQGSLAASLAWRPWMDRQLLVGFAAGAGAYGRHSAYYYSPEVDASGTLSVQGRLPIWRALAFAFDVGGGVGYAIEEGVTGFGPAWRAKAGFAWSRDGLALSLDGARSQSQRGVEYTTHELQLGVSWSF